MEEKHIEKVVNVAEEIGWSVDTNPIEKTVGFTFSKPSPVGQDFSTHVNANNLQELCDELQSNYEYFDASSESYLWLDDSGHGANGAPYEMGDVYNDMKACEKMLGELVDAMKLALFSRKSK